MSSFEKCVFSVMALFLLGLFGGLSVSFYYDYQQKERALDIEQARVEAISKCQTATVKTLAQ